MSTIPSVLAQAYTCGICRQTFTPKGPPIIGEQTEARLARVGQMLAQHIAEVHKAEHKHMVILCTQMQGWIMLDQFRHNDAELLEQSEKMRKHFRMITRRINIADDVIEKQVDANLNEAMQFSALRETCIKLLKGIRNTMDETTAA